jgi:hypothetical protein
MAVENVKIVALNTGRTTESESGSAMRQMYLTLSETPPHNWHLFFDKEREFPRHSMWRRAWVEHDHIVIDCVPDELEQYHLEDLKTDIANANENYRIALEAQRKKNDAQAKIEAEEKGKLEALNNRLNFD